MSNQNYIIEMLELKDSNVIFKENCYYKEKIKGVFHKIFEGYLSYKPTRCPKCDVLFDDKFEKHGFINSNIKIPDVSGFKAFRRFKARIMIYRGLLKIKKTAQCLMH